MHSLFQPDRLQKGFTILEVMIAMAIFAIGILGVAKMQILATSGNTTARTYTEAVAFAQDQMELLLLLPYDDTRLADTGAQNGTNQDIDGDNIDTSGNFGLDDIDGAADHTAAQGIYNLSWNIAVNEPITNAKRIRLFVRWPRAGSGTRQYVINSIKPSI